VTLRVVASVLLASALAAGVAAFPYAYEPGRAEAEGIDLSLLEGGRLDGTTWSRQSPSVAVAPGAGGAQVRAETPGVLLVSRTLAIRRDTCYALDVVASAPRGDIVLALADESATRTLAAVRVPPSAAPRRSQATASSRGERRFSVVVSATGPATVLVRSLRLTPAPDAACPG
jgi:hypothetical protein